MRTWDYSFSLKIHAFAIRAVTLICLLSFRDRISLCQLWKSIVLNDQERMQYFSKELGVDGEFYSFKGTMSTHLVSL